MLVTEIITNNAAALLFFPIALQVMQLAGHDSPEALKAVGVTVAMAVSCAFATPIGYQVNTIVYGPGGYKYKDFLVFGGPMQIVLWILSVAFLVIEKWYISWIVTAVALVFVCITRVANSSLSSILGSAASNKKKVEQPGAPTTTGSS